MTESAIVREVLPNGLRLLTERMPHVRSVSIGVWLARGSRHEPQEQSGIAHFVEHMLFKGTRTRTAEDIAQAIDSVGGQMDAFTAKEYASYYIKVLDEHLPFAVDVLSDIVMNPKFSPDDLEREKKVVLEEIKMVEDTPDDLVHELFTENFWADHPLGRPILGTRETVESLTADGLRRYFGSTYTAPNLIVAAVGNVSHDRVRDIVTKAFGSLPTSSSPIPEGAPRAVPCTIIRNKELEQSHICLGTSGYQQDHEERYSSYVMNTILGGSMSSRLFQNVREKRGLAYAVFSGLSAYRDTGSMTIYAGCANDAVGELIDVVIGELRKVKDEAIDNAELRRAKDHLKGSLMLNLESTSSRMSHIARQEIYFDRQFGLDETLEGVERVTPDDIQRVARDLFSPDALAATVLGAVNGLELPRSDCGSVDARSMIERYTNPEMGRIWRDQRKYETWLQVEVAAADAMARAGIIPAEAAKDIRERGAFDIAKIEEIEQTTQHDVIAFTTAVAEHVGESARWLHFGLTSSDVIDTAQALQMREACDVILKTLDALQVAVRGRAEEHRRTPMIGRTHGVHAEPMTFGLKLALWYAELSRDVERIRRARQVIAVGQLSGAVGTFAHLPPTIEADACRTLGLEPAAVTSQVIQRDRHAELLSALAITASSLEKFALEIRGLQKTEIGEVEEPFAKGQKGSSAMPHKRNPIGCEQIVGLARLVRANAGAALENNALWHERDISHSSVERVILPDSFIALDHMLRRFTRIVAGMVVYPDRMRANLDLSRGVVFSGTVLLELARRGISREQAYEWVQRNAMRAFHEKRQFKDLLLADADVTKAMSPPEIERAFDLDEQLKYIDFIFERVFARQEVPA